MERTKELVEKYPNNYKLGKFCREFLLKNKIDGYINLIRKYPNDFYLGEHFKEHFKRK